MKLPLFICFILLVSCSTRERFPSIDLGALPDDEIAFQQQFISQLTGEKAIQTAQGEKLYLNSRWSIQERRITVGYLTALFKQLGLTTYTHHYTIPNINVGVDLLLEPLKGTNIYTVLPATNNSTEYVLIGAHYDTDGQNFPGALDNGSGMALISSVLKQATQLKNRNKNLLVVYFDQEEENSSVGSISFAKFLKSEQYDIHSVHSYDLIGWDGDNNKEIQLALPSEAIEATYRTHATQLNIPLYVTDSKSSDYYSFIKEGINAVGISQAYAKGDVSGKKDSTEDQYHLVNFDYLASCTNLAFEVIKDLLND